MLPQDSHCAVADTRLPVALMLVALALRDDVQRLTHDLALTLEFVTTTTLAVTRIETACPEMVVFDADVVGAAHDFCRFTRSLRPDVRLIAVTCPWSERDEALRGLVDAIIHKPPRESEWMRVLASPLSHA